jgi:hypothetical protein
MAWYKLKFYAMLSKFFLNTETDFRPSQAVLKAWLETQKKKTTTATRRSTPKISTRLLTSKVTLDMASSKKNHFKKRRNHYK